MNMNIMWMKQSVIDVAKKHLLLYYYTGVEARQGKYTHRYITLRYVPRRDVS
jgi:hypothetical protein